MTVKKKTVISIAIVSLIILAVRHSTKASYVLPPKLYRDRFTKPNMTAPKIPAKPNKIPDSHKPTKINPIIFDAIKTAAEKHNVPLNISLAVAKVESNFSPTAVSPKGAIGLYQLMPKTAAGYKINPNNPIENADAGNRFLAAMFKKYGDWNNALAAYNWGPGNVDKELKGDKIRPSTVPVYINKIMRLSESFTKNDLKNNV